MLLRDGGENLGRINRRNTWSTFSGSGTSRAIENFFTLRVGLSVNGVYFIRKKVTLLCVCFGLFLYWCVRIFVGKLIYCNIMG